VLLRRPGAAEIRPAARRTARRLTGSLHRHGP